MVTRNDNAQIPMQALEKQKQDDSKFKTSLSYMVSSGLARGSRAWGQLKDLEVQNTCRRAGRWLSD